MGTRNLTMVKVDGKVKVAHYGQWDGYPTGQGVTVAEFVQAYLMDDALCREFAAKVRAVKRLTKKQAEKVDAEWSRTEKEVVAELRERFEKGHHISIDRIDYRLDHFKTYYSRDAGAEILKSIWNARECPPLCYEGSFLKETLFCEWAYCLDLDAGVVEVYAGDTKPAMVIAFADFTVRRMRTLRDEVNAATKDDPSVTQILRGDADSEVA